MSKKKTESRSRAQKFLDDHREELTTNRSNGYKFPPAAIAIIDAAHAERKQGHPHSLNGLARILKRKFDIPIQPKQVAKKIVDHLGGEPW